MADNRLVLHILRLVDPACHHLTGHSTEMVPLSIAGEQPRLGIAVGNRGLGQQTRRTECLDLSLDSLRGQFGLQLWSYFDRVSHLDLDITKGKDDCAAGQVDTNRLRDSDDLGRDKSSLMHFDPAGTSGQSNFLASTPLS